MRRRIYQIYLRYIIRYIERADISDILWGQIYQIYWDGGYIRFIVTADVSDIFWVRIYQIYWDGRYIRYIEMSDISDILRRQIYQIYWEGGYITYIWDMLSDILRRGSKQKLLAQPEPPNWTYILVIITVLKLLYRTKNQLWMYYSCTIDCCCTIQRGWI